ncbi:MAG: hypothetical protein JW795_15975, partial [Chitinivibrionales bacterium]|nr:hypothetical protein [Chitinivibrionales bacterium]
DPEKFSPKKKPATKITIKELTFNGLLSQQVKTKAETPLSEAEKAQPLAWQPLMNLLWTELKVDVIATAGNKIIGEKWQDPEIFRPYQDIAALYFHGSGDSAELWLEIEVSPWVTFIDGIGDDDKDGFREFYGKLSASAIDGPTMAKAYQWVTDVYAKKELTREEIVDWANVLASYWYPTLNTDIVAMGENLQWPIAETEKEVVSSLKGKVFKNPSVLIRGVPINKPLYMIFMVEQQAATAPAVKKDSAAASAGVQTPAGPKHADTTISVNFTENNKRWKAEVQPFGTYEKWYTVQAPINEQLKAILAKYTKEQVAITGLDGWLFFRRCLEYSLAKDLEKQPVDKNPVPHLVAFKKYCDAHGMNLLFVPVPNKEELYYEKLGIKGTKPETIISPYGRKLLAELQAQGVEVIDLLPVLKQAQKEDGKSAENVFQTHDTHWTGRGMHAAAQAIAERIKQYSWYKDFKPSFVNYTFKDTTFERLGDIIGKLPDTAKSAYKPARLKAQQVKLPDGTLYKPNSAGPILLIGDSFTGTFELIDCKSAGVGSHVAQLTSLPVDIATSWGGGPLVVNKAIKGKKESLASKRLIIYMMTARDLYDYSQGWEALDAK